MSDQGSDLISKSGFRPVRFAKPRNAGVWALLASLGALDFYVASDDLVGLTGAVLALYCLQAAFVVLLGQKITRERISLPRPIDKRYPIFVLGRMRIATSLLKDVTSAGTFLGNEVVLLNTPAESAPALFSSRADRMAFFNAILTLRPDLKIYRTIASRGD